MEKPFDDLHAGIESQILNLPAGIPDSDDVKNARRLANSPEGFLALGKALSRQLRYREAIDAYSAALALEPENLAALRLRAGRYLTTLQSDQAIAEFERCLSLGSERLDCLYRIGLAHYFAGRYAQATDMFRRCMPLCNDEMGIAVIYWHTLSASQAEVEPCLLDQYHTEMDIGHHTAYEKAIRVWSGKASLFQVLTELEKEPDDMEYCIVLYGLLYYPDCQKKEELLENLLKRDGFWPCFSYLAAWSDQVKIKRNCVQNNWQAGQAFIQTLTGARIWRKDISCAACRGKLPMPLRWKRGWKILHQKNDTASG